MGPPRKYPSALSGAATTLARPASARMAGQTVLRHPRNRVAVIDLVGTIFRIVPVGRGWNAQAR